MYVITRFIKKSSITIFINLRKIIKNCSTEIVIINDLTRKLRSCRDDSFVIQLL